jgi:hypothetical protein
MSIRCVCPNGHILNVRESLAGVSGLCPTCRARVKVPEPRRQNMSEDAILDILEPKVPVASVVVKPSKEVEVVDESHLELGTEHSIHNKHCYKCNREFPPAVHICPFCHTYIARLSDFGHLQ